jgi:hypothetical protein
MRYNANTSPAHKNSIRLANFFSARIKSKFIISIPGCVMKVYLLFVYLIEPSMPLEWGGRGGGRKRIIVEESDDEYDNDQGEESEEEPIPMKSSFREERDYSSDDGDFVVNDDDDDDYH